MPLNPRLTDWHGRVAWVIGASSGIGLATARALRAQGASIVVSAREDAPLQAFASAHSGCLGLALDVGNAQALREAAQTIWTRYGRLDLVLYSAGHYRPQRATQFNLPDMLQHQQVNYVGALHMLDAVLPHMLRARAGHISLVGSVAGYRALPQALAYGPTKAAIGHLAEALYLDLHDQGLGVSLVSPGFVDTPLTAQNTFTMPALLSTQQAAERMLTGWASGDFEIHFPKRFTFWLRLLRHLPDALYFATVRRTTGG